MKSVRELIHARSERYMGWYLEACSIPSLAENADGLDEMAEWVESKLVSIGASVERLTHDGAPDVLLGQIGSGDRSVLIYNHYDVQPVDPLDLWNSKPFEPRVSDGVIYARGASDNKGDLVARLAGLQIYQEVFGELPLRIKFLVEGEEENGSRSLAEIVSRHRSKLEADGCIWEGAGTDHVGRPKLTFGVKGLAYVELVCRGLSHDQHSQHAVIVPSPVWHLVEALNTLRTRDGRVQIDGFYDDVVAPTDADLESLEAYPYDEEAERGRLGVDRFINDDSGISLLRRLFYEPTCNIAGIISGFTVPGASKTVLPKEVMAKLDMRLVPNQNPVDIVDKLRRHLDKRGFDDIEINRHQMQHPVRSPNDSPIARAAVAASEDVFGKSSAAGPTNIGTGPMHAIADTLGVPMVSPAGVCRPESNIHAPNERARVEDFLRIIEYTDAWIIAFANIDL